MKIMNMTSGTVNRVSLTIKSALTARCITKIPHCLFLNFNFHALNLEVENSKIFSNIHENRKWWYFPIFVFEVGNLIMIQISNFYIQLENRKIN